MIAAGCGAITLTGAEASTIARANEAFAFTALDGSSYPATLRGVDDVIALYRSKPDAEYDGHPMSDVLKDAATTLRSSNPDLSRRLDRELR